MNHYLVFDIGGTEIKYGVITEDATLIFKDKFPSRGETGGKYILDDIILRVKELSHYNPKGIGISSAGVINSSTGEVLSATNTIVDYIGMNVITYIKERTGLDVSVLNDVNAMALCESNDGAAKNSKLMIALTIGTGIGGAIVLNNQLIEGNGYNAGEFGLMKFNGEDYEQLAATSILVKNAKSLIGEHITNGVDVFRLYDEQNPMAIKLVNQFYEHLSQGIANLTYAFNPEVIVIGGGVTGRDSFITELESYVMAKLTPHLRKYTKLVAAKHRNDAGMIGAYFHYKNQHLS